ncbi:guanine permease [candidate division WOR-3 bacterium 4484_100]|uniref:Guanine permease n=1 Tax=candidate division WOR-3 bacterium 4484_100 TaxID=1936077 RepID=A0A1V4QDK0_UNCW3|nr:MAG: guanine permease [candidate division WOR-3 bacterium 4484_100]
MKKFFALEELGTNVKTEILAGVTTFMTMAYIVVVNPAILQVAGIPKGPSMVATILSAFFGTIIMGVYAKRPFAIAPYMGENAFVAYTVVKVLGYSWQTALGAIFIGGVLFTLITILKLRSWLANAIPLGLKYSFAVGIGLFLTFIGLNDTGLVKLGVPGAPVQVGNIRSPEALLAVFAILLIAILIIKKVRGAILIGILATTFLSFIFKIAPAPTRWLSLPPSLSPIFLKLDILGALSWGFFAVILTVFVMDFVDTMGTLIGVSARAGLLDENGNLPEIEKPMLADALATVFGALVGTTTTGTFIESATGIEEGGRSGLTAVVTALLFLVCLFFAPLFTAIPAQAYGPALIIVGMFMISSITKIDFSDYTELIPAFFVITLMSFTYNLGIGITAGFVLYPIFKLVSGRTKEVASGLWFLFVLSILFYIFFPY